MDTYPVWLRLAQRRGGVDVHRLLLHHCLVALLRVLARRVEEEAAGDGLRGASGKEKEERQFTESEKENATGDGLTPKKLIGIDMHYKT